MTLLKRNPGAAISPKLHNNSFFWGSIYAKFVNLHSLLTNFCNFPSLKKKTDKFTESNQIRNGG